MNPATDLIPELSFKLESELLWIIEDDLETKCVIETQEFLNWLITTGEPYANNGIDNYIYFTPSNKIISKAIEFDQIKRK